MTPHAVEQLRLGHHSIAVRDQHDEEVERLRLEMHDLSGSTDLATVLVDLDLAEPDHARSLAVRARPCQGR